MALVEIGTGRFEDHFKMRWGEFIEYFRRLIERLANSAHCQLTGMRVFANAGQTFTTL